MGLTRRLLAHDAWATRVLLDRCRSLPAEQFHARFDIGPGSLHDTFRHIVGAVRRWTDRLADRPLRPRLEESGPYAPDELLALLDEAAREFAEMALRIEQHGRLDESLQAPLVGAFTPGTAIVHVAAHGVHHRAQVLNMLRRLGATDLPDVDPISWEQRTR